MKISHELPENNNLSLSKIHEINILPKNKPKIDELETKEALIPEETIDQLNKALALSNESVRFKMDKEANKMVYYVIDNTNDEVIRQIPSPELLKISKNIKNYLDNLQNELKNVVTKPTPGVITSSVA